MANIVEYNVKPMYNVYACVPGHIANETVFLGNHRDAWAFGAADPGSGTAVMHEIVKSIGALVNPPSSSSSSSSSPPPPPTPFRPLRQIMIASWDGEEFGLAGSTEFGEDFSDFLQENVAVYHNLDIAVQGRWLSLGAVPSLIDVFERSAARLPNLRNKGDDEEGVGVVAGKGPLEFDRSLEIRRTSALGSGSDYTVFLQRNGIAASMASYRRRRDDPAYMYHSNFDSFHWMETYGDPHFRRHESMAKLVGLVALRSASEPSLPIRPDHYAAELSKYLIQVERALGERRWMNESLSLSGVKAAVEKVKKVAGAVERVRAEAVRAFVGDGVGKDEAARRLAVLNALVARFEHGFLARSPSSKGAISYNLRSQGTEETQADLDLGPGLPFRPWFRHLIIAPGRQSGYGATPFPGLMEALTLEDVDPRISNSSHSQTHSSNTSSSTKRRKPGAPPPTPGNMELAKEEADRIVEVLEALADRMEAGLRACGTSVEQEEAGSIGEKGGLEGRGREKGYKARV
ncbi:hypothetical protein V8E36_002305 [Tilletia maclaganii]